MRQVALVRGGGRDSVFNPSIDPAAEAEAAAAAEEAGVDATPAEILDNSIEAEPDAAPEVAPKQDAILAGGGDGNEVSEAGPEPSSKARIDPSKEVIAL